MNVTEFSRRVDLNPHTVRYYDKIGLLDDVQRLQNGHRSFSQKDVKWIEFVKRLKDTGMPLSTILEYAALRKEGNKSLVQREQILLEHAKNLKQHISEQTDNLNKLEDKIKLYQSAIHGKISLD